MKIAVAGTGYVGLSIAAGQCEHFGIDHIESFAGDELFFVDQQFSA